MAHEHDGETDQTSANAQISEHSAASLRCYHLGQSEFPKIAWPEAKFEAAWQKYSADMASETPSDDALRDEYLRLGCLSRAPGAIETLEADYIVPLGPILTKRTADPDLAVEALQLLRHKLLLGDTPRLSSYRSTGHLRAWLQVVAVRTSQDLARQRGARWARETSLFEQLVSPASQPDDSLMKHELDEVFAAALRTVIRSLPARERYALRMHLLAGWNVSQIGEALSTHRATAARWIVSAKERINDQVRGLLRERLDLSGTELERLFTLLGTHFDLRLSYVFQTNPALGETPEEARPE